MNFPNFVSKEVNVAASTTSKVELWKVMVLHFPEKIYLYEKKILILIQGTKKDQRTLQTEKHF